MEFSKTLLNRSWIVTLVLTTIVAIFSYCGVQAGDLSVLAGLSWGELSAAHVFYFWKARHENKLKITKDLVKDLADQYGIDSVVSILSSIISE